MMIEEEIYDLYPKHIGKRDAITAIKKAIQRLPDELHETELDFSGNGDRVCKNPFLFLKEKVIAFAKSPAGHCGIYTPHASTWFNRSSYLDDESEWQRHGEEKRISNNERRTHTRRSNIVDAFRTDANADVRRGSREHEAGTERKSNTGVPGRILKASSGSD
jgi:hypothetical protein